ncbi:MAG: acyl-CoA dehydrogenase [Thiobacillus sp. 65-69]|nr:acyl-CoA/acyl-ACP dehydrogenase [Thiobacillus sp.]ODT28512.1 MAG: isovaleryl-CoA dehydrogenase [Hyphomicrobium sp. SCN 65-11]ODU87540.1 MAG: isovaleryl-CoA dehydrogenase [Thiobacillus sp. SCN 65-179]OJW38711.1 MAG: acyl-CoA dehydrogenase [Thiobacillus sp. 65-69]
MDRQDFASLMLKVQDIAREVVAPGAAMVDAEANWPDAGIRAMQRAGLGGLVVPTAYGGMGHGLQALVRVCETLGQECASTAICFGMHCVGASVIAANATPDQQARFLTPICEGRHITTLSLSEAGTGAHFYLPQTTLDAVSDEAFSVTGSKTFVTNGGQADSYVVSAVAASPEAPIGQFSCVVVPADAEGIHWGADWDGLGMRGNSSRTMELQGVRVPRSNLLGKEGDQIWYIFNVVTPNFLIAMAGTFLGVATTALEEARRHLSRRYHTHTGSSLAQASVLQHRLGTLWGMLERTRRLTYHAAASFDAGDPDSLTAVMAAKVEVADCVVTVVNEAMTLCGGIGYRKGSRLHRLLRDARAAHLMSPTTDILRVWIGRALLGQPLLSD